MSVIDDYLAEISSENRVELERILKIVNDTVPDAIETISYGMPAFKYKGKYLVGFYVYKNHLSIFPTSKPIELLKSKLAGFRLSKGTIQFTLDNTIPEAIIKEILSIQVENIINSVKAVDSK